MVDRIILSEKTKEELIEIIKGLYKENEELKQKVKEQQQRNVEKFVKANVKKEAPDASRAKDRPYWNHPPVTRSY